MGEVIKYIQLPFLFAPEKLQEELSSLNTEWIAHFNKLHYEGEWSALPLKSYGGSLTNVMPDVGATSQFLDTPLMEQCPYMKSITELLPGEKRAVRLLRLKPGAIIKEHTDKELCYEDGEVRIHVPITTNEQVEFYLEGERIMMREGECWYLNFNLPHAIANKGTTDRVHLVIDCIVNDEVKDLFEYKQHDIIKKVAVKDPYSANDKLQMIERLKEMGTPTANELIKKIGASISSI